MATPPREYIKNVKEKDKYLNSIIDDHQRYLNRAIIGLENRIMELFNELKINNSGFVKTTQINFKNAQRIHRQLEDLFENTYKSKGLKVLQDYKKIEKKINKLYDSLDITGDYGAIDSVVIERLRNNAFANYLAFGEVAKEQIVEELYNQVIIGGSRMDLIKTVSAILTGRLDKRGRPMTQYAELWANDEMMNFQNSVTLQKAEMVGIETFLYYGNVITTTRPFCLSRAGHKYTKETINSWTFSWKGKSGPALTNRGGWNCRHHWVPINPSWDDEEIVDLLNPTK